MATHNETKLKTLFKLLQPNNVLTATLLDSKGVSRHLRKYYLESGWLEPLGRGAYKKPDDKVEWQGAVNALQKQLKIEAHVGGLSALTLHGYSHYLRLSKEILYLFSSRRTRLPKWFTDYNWGVELFHKPTVFLPENIGIKETEVKGINVNVSTPERAILECLYLAPQHIDLVECYQVFEGLANLKPNLLTELLFASNSIKVKRLFLYLAEKANHQWLNFLNIDDIDKGVGDRMITKNGVYNAKYGITIPKELAEL
jgi:predicted transcriptional regulator of viral defense system